MQDTGCKMQDAGYRMQDAYPVCGFFEDKYPVPGSRSRVPGTWDPGSGTGSTPRAEHRAPKTEPGYRKTRTSGMQTPWARFPVRSSGLGIRPSAMEG